MQASYPQYVLVDDNIDKNVSPHDMRVDHQTKSFHYFHSYAVHDRIDLSEYSNGIPDIDVESLPLTTFLPSLNDCKKLRENYIILVSRVLVKHLAFLATHRAYSLERVDKEVRCNKLYVFCVVQSCIVTLYIIFL